MYIQKFGKKIISLHYHDNNGKTDDHLDVGEGTVPWKEVVESIKMIKFKGPFISECFNSKPHEARDTLIRYF